jgi:4-aminobutyrate aminotransferase
LDEALSRILPSNLTRYFYCNSGSEAVENAVKIARAATGRQDIIAFDVSGKGCNIVGAYVKTAFLG